MQVTVVNPGDSPEDVEEGILVKIEEAIEGTEGVKKVRSVAREGAGTVLAEIESGTEEDERDRILADIKNAVDRAADRGGSVGPARPDRRARSPHDYVGKLILAGLPEREDAVPSGTDPASGRTGRC
ncbi:MAG: efflux RND transporter permease subunit [Planctomycetes bacterium]|nr:efflux RND transporter permease subunit [Planctomycetota bacterium]